MNKFYCVCKPLVNSVFVMCLPHLFFAVFVYFNLRDLQHFCFIATVFAAGRRSCTYGLGSATPLMCHYVQDVPSLIF